MKSSIKVLPLIKLILELWLKLQNSFGYLGQTRSIRVLLIYECLVNFFHEKDYNFRSQGFYNDSLNKDVSLKPNYKLNSLNYIRQIASHKFRMLFSKDQNAMKLNCLYLEILNFQKKGQLVRISPHYLKQFMCI